MSLSTIHLSCLISVCIILTINYYFCISTIVYESWFSHWDLYGKYVKYINICVTKLILIFLIAFIWFCFNKNTQSFLFSNRYKVHKIVMAANSSYFMEKFNDTDTDYDFPELADFDSNALSIVIRYFYTGNIGLFFI